MGYLLFTPIITYNLLQSKHVSRDDFGVKHDFLIVGGGIAGLTAAIALQKEGFDVKVLERSGKIRNVGAGLGLGANAWRGLKLLGITKALGEKCEPLQKVKFLTPDGKAISILDLKGLNEKYGGAYFAVRRADLHKCLVRQLKPDTLHLGKKIVSFDQDETGVRIYTQEGETFEGKALIAADGLHSAIRRLCLPRAKLRYAGYTCWRAVVKRPVDTDLQGEFIETWGRKGRMGLVPLKDDQIYWYACVNAPTPNSAFNDFTTRDLLHLFGDYHSPIPEIIKETGDEKLIWGDIFDMKPKHRFAFHKVLLIGDAAHATTPNIGQGAGQAIEDALVLSQVVKHHLSQNKDGIEEAFLQFEQIRRTKTKKIISFSWQVGKVAQLDHPVLIGMRNVLMGMLPSFFLEKQFDKVFRTDF